MARTQFKQCSVCNEVLSLSSFYLRKDTGQYGSNCIGCHTKRCTRYNEMNKEKIEQYYKEYYALNSENLKKHVQKWRKDNPIKAKLMDKNKYLHCDKNKRNELCRAWSKRNKHKTRFWSAERRKYVKNQQLKTRFKNELKALYANCPKGFAVDHIVPIRSESVCGLHVPWNLQYLDKKVNLMKSNHFDGSYENADWKTCLEY